MVTDATNRCTDGRKDKRTTLSSGPLWPSGGTEMDIRKHTHNTVDGIAITGWNDTITHITLQWMVD